MSRIAVIFYSATGNTARLAQALAAGAQDAGAEVRVRAVAETAPQDAIARNPNWQRWVEDSDVELATLDDLVWCDGFALGSPTRFGGAAAQLKQFLDTTGGLWAQHKLADKVGTSFTSASTEHGGLESTILAMNNVMYHWGALVMPLGYADRHVLKESGNPYGASFVSRAGAAPNVVSLEAARLQGARLARVAESLSSDLR